MNLCIFTGRLSRDPELTQTNSGKNVVDFGIAVNEGKDANGDDRVTFVNCQAWDATATFIAQFFTKGKPISVQSRLKNERWEDAEGQARRSERFVVDRAFFVPGEPKQGNNSGEEQAQATPEPAKRTRKPRNAPAATPAPASSGEGFEAEVPDDDIPF